MANIDPRHLRGSTAAFREIDSKSNSSSSVEAMRRDAFREIDSNSFSSGSVEGIRAMTEGHFQGPVANPDSYKRKKANRTAMNASLVQQLQAALQTDASAGGIRGELLAADRDEQSGNNGVSLDSLSDTSSDGPVFPSEFRTSTLDSVGTVLHVKEIVEL